MNIYFGSSFVTFALSVLDYKLGMNTWALTYGYLGFMLFSIALHEN